MPENSDWISCSGCENSRSSGEKPNFDPKPQKTRNDSSYQFKHEVISRAAFGAGALFAARALMNLDKGFYTMEALMRESFIRNIAVNDILS